MDAIVDSKDTRKQARFSALVIKRMKRLRDERERDRRAGRLTITIDLGFFVSEPPIGHVTINESVLTDALLAMRRTGRTYNNLEDERRLCAIESRTILATLDKDVNEWFRSNLLVNPMSVGITREQFLARLESWPTRIALELIRSPAAQRHILRIRSGTRRGDKEARKRLRNAFQRLAAEPERRGPKPHALPSCSPEIARAWLLALTAVRAVNRRYFSDADLSESGADALSAVKRLLRDLSAPDTPQIQRAVFDKLRRKVEPIQITEFILATRFGVSTYKVRKSV